MVTALDQLKYEFQAAERNYHEALRERRRKHPLISKDRFQKTKREYLEALAYLEAALDPH